MIRRMLEPKENRVTYLGRTTFRNQGTLFGIRRQDRRSHTFVLGKTGTGKSTLLQTLVSQDIRSGEGFALFDPHGDLAARIRELVPLGRERGLVYLNVPDPSLQWNFNPLSDIPKDKHALAVAGFVEVFKKLWPDDWGPRLEHLLRNVIFALLEVSGNLADIPLLLTDRGYRENLVARIENPFVRAFWQKEYKGYSPAFRAVVIAPLQNKIGALLTDPVLRRILTGRNSIDLRGIMDSGGILLVNLDKGRIGEGPAALLGAFLVSHIAFAALSRSERPETSRRDFWVYLDEFHTFTTLSLASMLAELRKYRVGMILANQYLSQLEPEIRDAVFGNTGTTIVFRVGGADAGFLAREFAPTFVAEDFLAIPRYNIYLRLMIEGETSAPFSAKTLDPRDPGLQAILQGQHE